MLSRREAMLGLAAGILTPVLAKSADAAPSMSATWPDVGRPPLPLAKLRVVPVDPRKRITSVIGGGDEDLLLTLPKGTATGSFQIAVDGFRGIYLIGGDVRIEPWGTLRSPNGSKVAGVTAFMRIRNHRRPVSRPFVYLSRIGYRPAPRMPNWPTEVIFGDFLQCGGAAPVGEWGAWPDIYRSFIRAGPFYGWGGYYGQRGDGYNSLSRNVSHADFIKPEMGGIRHLFTSNIDVRWGYQCEFASRPSFATDYRRYAGPDGAGYAFFWRYLGRAVSRSDLGTEREPVIMWLADDASRIAQGAYSTAVFGSKIYLVPLRQGPITQTVKPREGVHKAVEVSGILRWPRPGPDGRAIGQGFIRNGRVYTQLPGTCPESSIGTEWRVATRTQLLEYIREDKHLLA